MRPRQRKCSRYLQESLAIGRRQAETMLRSRVENVRESSSRNVQNPFSSFFGQERNPARPCPKEVNMAIERNCCSNYECLVKVKGVTVRPIPFSQMRRADGEGSLNVEVVVADNPIERRAA